MAFARSALRAPEFRLRRVRSLLFLGTTCFLSSTLAAAWGAWIPAQHPGLRWEGRVRFAKDRSAIYDWSNVRLHATFQGPRLAIFARLGENTLDVRVDGKNVAVLCQGRVPADAPWASQAVQAVASGGTPVFLLEGLGEGLHELLVTKRTGPNFGPLTFLGLRLDESATLGPPPAAPARRLEFIGDSLSNAYGVEGPGKQCAALRFYENACLSWARLCAEALGAEAQVLAYSGYGLVRNYGAAAERSEDPLPRYYPRTVLAEPDGLWPREAFKPDLSVVFLGTNDYSTAPHPSDEAFENAYRVFLDEIRRDRAGLKILLAYVDDGSRLAARVQAVAKSQQMVGRWVELLPLSRVREEEFGCDWHPKMEAQRRWAREAEIKIRNVLGWK